MSDEFDETQDGDEQETNPTPTEFDFARYPANTLFHERRTGPERRGKGRPETRLDEPDSTPVPTERRAKKDRRRRIDPTTFEKQYTDDELEFMNAMQRFKDQSGKSFPSHGDVLKVAAALGYRRVVIEPLDCREPASTDEPISIHPSPVEA
jgi:hypothetical protein